MRSAADLLDQTDLASRGHVLSTGLRDLDEVTGGWQRGHLWILLSGPGQGRTTLAIQWALQTAKSGRRTTLICPREPSEAISHRLLANTGNVPLIDLQRSRPVHADRLEYGRRMVTGLPLTVAAEGDSTWLTLVGCEDALEPGDVLVVDDADLAPGVFAARMRAIAERGVLIILTMPRHLLIRSRGRAGWLDAEWARAADVVLEIRQATGSDDRASLRPGEADLFVLKNRRGPTLSSTLLFQGHFARFIDMGE